MFFPDWIDFDKVQIPQADEQQRLLTNLIQHVNRDQMPLPRFWYFPRGEKAVVVMTGDDHGSGGTSGQFAWFASQVPAGCSVADWECVRATSYIFNGELSDSIVAGLEAQGFEIALHVNTGCDDWTPASLDGFYDDQLADLRDHLPERLGARHQPDPLHRVERLGDPAQGRARPRDPPRHELLLLARGVGPGPTRHVHRLRHADALRRPRRNA